MNKGLLRNVLIVLLFTITAFSVFKYLVSLKEKYDLMNSMKQVQQEVAVLSQEKQNLLQDLEKEKQANDQLVQDNAELRDYLKASREKITKLFKEVRETQDAIEDLNDRITLAKAENRALLEETEIVKSNLNQVTQENTALKTKLSSVAELKKAIRELKKRKRMMAQEITEIKIERIIEGNRGFLIKDGKATSPAKVRIEVIPAQKEP